MDDWREYNTRMLGSYDLSYLFISANDTLYPVGKFLDSLAYRTLNGNTIAYQFVSMIFVLGLLLYFQWKLLILAVKDRLLASCAFVFTLLMLQPDSYWGLQNMAFHQGLPVVGILASIFILVRPKWNPLWALPSLFVIGILSGFSYISGAFSILTVSLVWLFAAFFTKALERKRLLYSGLSLLVAGLITSAAQFWVIAVKQHGTHRPDAPMGYPWESDFWFYYLGKLGRSLMMPTHYPVTSLVIVLIAVLVVLAIFWLYFKELIGKKYQTLDDARPALIYASIFGAILVYLSLVSAGRVNLRFADTQSPTEIFIFGFGRFHYFWATVLWPWVAAACFMLCRGLFVSTEKRLYLRVPIVASLALATLMICGGSFEHSKYFKKTMVLRSDAIRCIATLLAQRKDVFCPQVDIISISAAYSFGSETGASFVKILPVVPLNPEPNQTSQ
ncbi:MAG: hypothetical protein EOP04_08945 [Proteobacteria bacterium]|nr:MAG: hypothetical protein EOP04_08945 [Pseudomonadota bacterium]